MRAEKLAEIMGADFYAGVPDSQLKALCQYLIRTYGTDPRHHIIAANEGNCTAIAAGYHLATGKIPVVYMQNSGEGNAINPIASLLHEEVYGIPMILVIGWRGEPGIYDEPQHIYQGKVTESLLDIMGIPSYPIRKETTEDELRGTMAEFKGLLDKGKIVAFIVGKGALRDDEGIGFKNDYEMSREEIIRCVTQVSDGDPVITTTGKASRELFEIREQNGQGHQYDFLTVGSMGHSSSIALGIALNKPDTKVWCIDGDGAALMHMGAMAVIGQMAPDNMIHVVINNGAHESVGGMPTAAGFVKLSEIAKGCGYRQIYHVSDETGLKAALTTAKKEKGLAFIEVEAAIGAREDLGRPTTTPVENKKGFMEFLKKYSS